jgi:hypothetical protein
MWESIEVGREACNSPTRVSIEVSEYAPVQSRASPAHPCANHEKQATKTGIPLAGTILEKAATTATTPVFMGKPKKSSNFVVGGLRSVGLLSV